MRRPLASPRRCQWAARARATLGAALAGVLLLGAPPARSEGPLARIRERGAVVIATDPTYQPFEFMEAGRLRGFDIDLGAEIARELGVRAEWLPMEWAGVFPALETGKCDLVLSGVTITEERKRGLGFSRPYFLSGQTLARRRGDPRIRTYRDLPGMTVAVQQETTGQTAAERLGLPRHRIRRFDTLPDALLDVLNGRSDAAIGDLPALREIVRRSFPGLELTGGVFVEENLGVVARRDETELIAAVNAALERIFVDGRYARIYETWVGERLSPAILAGLERVKAAGTPVAPRAAGAGLRPTASAGETRPAEPGDVVARGLPLLVSGAMLTLRLTALALLLGIPLGLAIALARLSALPPLRLAAMLYVEVIRGTPLLMQIYVIYFVLPAVGLSLPAVAAGVTALGLNAAAYLAEIFRAGIESIDPGQMEAARSLGMGDLQAMRWVILPQTVRRVLPPLTNEAVALLKDSSLVSVVALSELMRIGKELATTAPSPMLVYLVVALFYLAMTLPLTHLVRRWERKWRV